MGLMHEVRREFIAVPDANKGQIVYKWPDQNIRKFTRAIVEPDAVAVFMSQGQVMGVVPPGQHTLDARELPFLGMFVDWASGGDAFKAELYFIGTREYPNNRFGGRLDDVQDPQTGLVVTLRAFGEYALKVADPTKLILNLVGTVDVTNNDAITGWVAEQLLKVTRTCVTTQLMSGTWPILGLSAHLPDIEAAVTPAADGQLENYGVTISRLGNLDVNLAEEDSARLKKLAGDTAYSRLAGGFLQAAQAEALQGAGEGMAQGGGAVTPMFLGAGLGMAGQMMQAPGQAPPYPPPPAPGFAGGGAGYAPPPQQQAAPPQGYPPQAAPQPEPAAVPPPGVVETVASGAAAAAAAGGATGAVCANCQAQLREGAKFCDSCGTPTQLKCSNCNADLRPGAKFCDSCGTPTQAPPPAQ
ncbi:MAG: SPFH domain-containing protein [Acidimicrobiales bacterium]|jgi:membrane protease subunit (stomatin/prohibitin family)